MFRPETFFEKFRDSTWVPPAGIALLAVALAIILLRVDLTLIEATGRSAWWLYSGTPRQAGGILNTIAVSIISVAGILFSVTVVALQLASSQFSPRILQNFTEDRATQLVLGTFIGTFAFALIVQWAVEEAGGSGPEFVPRLSVSVALVLAVACMFLLIYFVDHIVHFIRAAKVVERMSVAATKRTERPFPTELGREAEDDVQTLRRRFPDVDAVRMDPNRSGFLEAIDGKLIFDLEKELEFMVEMEAEIGSYVLPGEILGRIRTSGGRLPPSARERVEKAFVIGPERTPLHDVDWALIELKDLAVKALSPGINDPTTAMLCINSIGQNLIRLGRTDPAGRVRTGEAGRVKLVTRPLPFERAVEDSIGPIRHHGGKDPAVAMHLLQVIGRVGEGVRDENKSALEQQISELLGVVLGGTPEDSFTAQNIRRAADEARERIRCSQSERERPSSHTS